MDEVVEHKINCIDTYNDTFTKNLIIDGPETIEFVIPADKMREIYEAFGEYQNMSSAEGGYQ